MENAPGEEAGVQGGEPSVEDEKAEEHGETVLPFGNPGDGLDAERMKGPKESENKGKEQAGFRVPDSGGKKAGGKAAEKEEEQDGGGRVEEDVGEVERPRVVAEEGNVQHVGDPEKGDVHGGGGDGGEEGITDGRKTKTVCDERVGRDERRVVEDDETEAERGYIEEEGEEKGEGAAEKDAAETGCSAGGRHGNPTDQYDAVSNGSKTGRAKMWKEEDS